MAARIVWLDQAKDDVRQIFDYIATDSPAAARNYVGGLTAACERLADFPLSGRRYDETFRCLVYRNHVIFYTYDETGRQVAIVMVIDGRRDLDELLS